ncbi:DUF5999 family protein [Streptomyces sp. NPDC004284]|uniref:DUF5999 family protein n=1 Tax=Streptomyces sp. NPDC004284 TaxID=3364695 RepID=UPI0036D1EADB
MSPPPRRERRRSRAAQTVVCDLVQGWSLLCNGVLTFGASENCSRTDRSSVRTALRWMEGRGVRRAATSDPLDWPAPRKLVAGATRTRVGEELQKRYDAGASIRDLAGQSRRSYTFVRALLAESGVTFRQRGG